jgi:hypothetical protein
MYKSKSQHLFLVAFLCNSSLPEVYTSLVIPHPLPLGRETCLSFLALPICLFLRESWNLPLWLLHDEKPSSFLLVTLKCHIRPVANNILCER